MNETDGKRSLLSSSQSRQLLSAFTVRVSQTPRRSTVHSDKRDLLFSTIFNVKTLHIYIIIISGRRMQLQNSKRNTVKDKIRNKIPACFE